MTMCDCDNIEIGSYDNTIILGYYPCMREYRDSRMSKGFPPNGIAVDKCIANDVISLWQLGIRTFGSCCGHNKTQPYIDIHEEDFEQAVFYGWESIKDANFSVYPKLYYVKSINESG